MRVSSTKFTWMGDRKMFVAEASDLRGWSPGQPLVLTSRYPGKAPITFRVDRTMKDADNDVTYWDLAADDFQDVGFSIRVFND